MRNVWRVVAAALIVAAYGAAAFVLLDDYLLRHPDTSVRAPVYLLVLLFGFALDGGWPRVWVVLGAAILALGCALHFAPATSLAIPAGIRDWLLLAGFGCGAAAGVAQAVTLRNAYRAWRARQKAMHPGVLYRTSEG